LRGNERKNIFKIGKQKSPERLKDIGQFFGIGESGAFQASRRVSQKIDRNRKLKAKIEKIEKGLKISRIKN